MTLIDQAIQLAAVQHEHQRLKGSDIPYIVHPFAVAVILAQAGCPDEWIAAGILHDTLEDTDLTLANLEQAMGPSVAAIVQGASEPEHDTAPWEDRKAHTIRYLRKEAPLEVRVVTAADKLQNIRSIASDLAVQGEAVWKRFNRGREDQAHYYRGLVESLCRRNDNTGYEPLFEALERQVKEVFP